MSKVGIIDADLMDNGTRHPNLALMKISGYYKEMGEDVKLIYKSYDEVTEYDRLFMSKVFNFTQVPEWVLELPNLEIGGTGFYEDHAPNLPDEIEHHMPDYHLYDEWVKTQIDAGHSKQNYIDYTDFSIGFTTRGCFRKCSFCVNKKYDHVFRHSPVTEFFDETRPNIYLWDDNILGFPDWEEVIDELDATGRPYQFRQGVDLRLMTDRKAMRLNNAKWYGDFIFAFDHIEDRDLISDKVQLWKRYSTKVCKMYVLSGYDSQDAEDIRNVFERIKILMYYGALPYIMRYQEYVNSEFKGMYIQLARWCNQPSFFKKKSFRQYCEANQEYQYHGKMDTYCASYQAMVDFEEKYPEIAAEYYDLRFDQENIYVEQYGYGRKYSNKTSCKECHKKYVTWRDFMDDNSDVNHVIALYFGKELDLQCSCYKNAECVDGAEYAAKLINEIMKMPAEGILKLVDESNLIDEEYKENIIVENVQAIVNIIVGYLKVKKDFSCQLKQLKEDLPAICESKELKFSKNIESYLKWAAQLDLIVFSMNRSKSTVHLSIMGKEYAGMSKKQKQKLMTKLFLRYPLIQKYWKQPESIGKMTAKEKKNWSAIVERVI